jgi:hypothetical protein
VTVRSVRVWVPRVWDMIALDVDANWSVASVKEAALIGATAMSFDLDDFIVKFRGAEIFDEGQSLDDLGVPDGAPMIVLRGRRQPVR